MPVHQIAVVPARETASDGKSAPRSKDKSEGGKTAGRSGSRSSTISKASSSTTGLGAGSASRTSVTPSSQDICSTAPLPRVDEDPPEVRSHPKPVRMPAKASQSTQPSTATAQKKQVKRRHRRKRDSNATLDSVSPSSKKKSINSSSKQEPTDPSSKQEPTDPSSKQEPTDRSSKQEPTDPSSKQEPTDRSDQSQSSEQGEKRELASKPRRELPPRHRSAAPPQPDTSEEEDERCRQSRSWSREKARRGRHRSRSRGGGGDRVEPMELQSVGSDEVKENQTPLENQAAPETEAGLKSRHGVGGPKEKKEGHGSLKGSTRVKPRKGSKSNSSSRSPKGSSSLAEDGEELITKRYKERGSGSGDMSIPSSRRRCSANVTAQNDSDDSELEVCRICHCEGDEECPLITPCFCTGSLRFVHQDCLNQWIKSSDTRCCELCKYNFIMETQLKPLRKWEKLEMTKNERRKIFCSVMFHLISVACVLWSIYILVQRTAKEISLGKDGVLEWPFWTKLILVAVAFSGGLIFMYIQCKVYLQLWRRLKAFNRIITVQNCPENGPPSCQAPPTANGKHQPVEVPMGPMGNCGQAAPTDSDLTDDAAVAPEESPV